MPLDWLKVENSSFQNRLHQLEQQRVAAVVESERLQTVLRAGEARMAAWEKQMGRDQEVRKHDLNTDCNVVYYMTLNVFLRVYCLSE